MNEEVKALQARVAELETQFQILSMAVVGAGDSKNHLGLLFLRMGLNTRDFREYYEFLNSVMGERALDGILEAFLKHFPHRQPTDLLEIGIAMYMNAPGGPMARMFMEAALRGIRAQDSPVSDMARG